MTLNEDGRGRSRIGGSDGVLQHHCLVVEDAKTSHVLS